MVKISTKFDVCAKSLIKLSLLFPNYTLTYQFYYFSSILHELLSFSGWEPIYSNSAHAKIGFITLIITLVNKKVS